jgi:hypothetical protein
LTSNIPPAPVADKVDAERRTLPKFRAAHIERLTFAPRPI